MEGAIEGYLASNDLDFEAKAADVIGLNQVELWFAKIKRATSTVTVH